MAQRDYKAILQGLLRRFLTGGGSDKGHAGVVVKGADVGGE
jgi:hypothetical protein